MLELFEKLNASSSYQTGEVVEKSLIIKHLMVKSATGDHR